MALRVDTRPRRKNSPRPAEKSAPRFKQWLRGRPCFINNGDCGLANPPRKSPTEPAHVDHAGGKGMGSKVADSYCVPLCQRHHDEQHGKTGSFRERGGWETFQRKYDFDAITAAENYWRAWPGRIAWEAKNNGA